MIANVNKFLSNTGSLVTCDLKYNRVPFTWQGHFFPMAEIADRLDVQCTSNIVVVVLVVLESWNLWVI